VFYNGSKLASNEFTATNGTTFVLATACQANDIVQAVVAVTGGGIGGSGTTNYISKWTASGVLNNSQIFDNGTNVGIGNTNTTYKLDVSGTGRFTDTLSIDTSVTMLRFGNLLRWGFQRPAADNRYVSFMRNMNATAIPVITMDGDNGNVGIGTSSPGSILELYAATPILTFNGTNTGTAFGLEFRGGGLDAFIKNTPGSGILNIASGRSAGWGGLITFTTDTTERMRITSGGNVNINTTTNAYSTAAQMNLVYNGAAVYGFNMKTTSSDGIHLNFVNTAGTQVGYIYSNSTTTGYYTSSDYRLKQDLKDYNALEILSKIKTYDYEWKVDNSRMYGVMAHELQEVIAYAVSGEKDGERMQGVDYSTLVPILIKSIQELSAKVSALENKS
jgi:hypothetical protein